MVGLLAPVLGWIFNRIYDGIDVDEAGLERALRVARAGAPIVICPSHKSHIDYLVMSWVLWTRGYQMPLVAAGANLSFFPLGPLLRRAGAFFLRRELRRRPALHRDLQGLREEAGARTASSRSSSPRAGARGPASCSRPSSASSDGRWTRCWRAPRNDLAFVPVAIDYEKIVEGSSYSKELLGGEKKPEDVGALIRAPKVLLRRYGTHPPPLRRAGAPRASS